MSLAETGILTDEELQRIYIWVDSIPLSRPKRNIARDFSDGGAVRTQLEAISGPCQFKYCATLGLKVLFLLCGLYSVISLWFTDASLLGHFRLLSCSFAS